MSGERQRTVGSLTADDLGSVVEVRGDDGEVWCGELVGRDRRGLGSTITLSLRQEPSPYTVATVEPETPCTVTPPAAAGTPGEREEGS